MLETVLDTKIRIPILQEGLLSRDHLITRLNEGLHPGYRLTLVSAPAGFGKTTLLSEWAGKLQIPLGWVTLEKEDGEPQRFWSYLISALQQVQPGIKKSSLTIMHSSQELDPKEIAARLINVLNKSADPCILVLDDYHVIESLAIHQSIDFLINHLPTCLHLVIATRADPPLSLSRLRGRGQLVELRTADLRFRFDEVSSYFKQLKGLDLSADDLEKLEMRTEGWVAGIQLAAISLEGRSKETIARFIASFSASQRYILDYLTDEVLLQQPKSVRAFMLRTSILDRLTASLCDAVTGTGEGQLMLETLETNNLFLKPLDLERRWYRYHRLFAEMLQKRLQQTTPDLVPVLHRRASQWYEEQGLTADALDHALLAGDNERITQFVVGGSLFMMEHTALKTLTSKMERLPDELVITKPWLSIARACLLAFMGHLDRVEPLLSNAEEAFSAAVLPAPQPDPTGYIAIVRAISAELSGSTRSAAEYARSALRHLPKEDLQAQGQTAIGLAIFMHKLNQLQETEDALAAAREISKKLEPGHIKVLIICTEGAFQRVQGRLREAAQTFRYALEVANSYEERAGRRLPVSGYAHMYLAAIQLEWNQLELAAQSAQTGIGLCEQWGEPQLLTSAYLILSAVYQAAGDGSRALSAIEMAIQTAASISSWYSAEIHPLKMLLLFRNGFLEPAFQWADSLEDGWADAFSSDMRLQALAIQARMIFAQGQADKALETLDRIKLEAENSGETKLSIQASMLQALAWHTQARIDRALAALHEALSLAESEGFIRTFIDEGGTMEELLTAAIRQGICVDYASTLLQALQQEIEGPPRTGAAAFEPLSERELEVLRLLTTSLTRAEIAERLFVTRNTVSSHIKNIYQKLEVSSRSEAIARGRELELL